MNTDWRLTYGDTDLGFGTVDSKFVFPQSGPPTIAPADDAVDDALRPRGDGTLFGADTRSGTSITFSVEINGENEAESLALLSEISQAWRADEIRSTPNAVAMLTAHTGRVTFGRPRKLTPNLELTPFGITAITCDFKTADDMWYGPEQSAAVNLVPAPGGGLVAPLVAPLSTTADSDRSQGFTVEGSLPVWPVIEITGPITNPEVEILGVGTLSYSLTLQYDQTLVIDTRPWARTSLRNGASVAGYLNARDDRLSDMSVPPGRHEVAFRGNSLTGTPTATLTWRNAYPTI